MSYLSFLKSLAGQSGVSLSFGLIYRREGKRRQPSYKSYGGGGHMGKAIRLRKLRTPPQTPSFPHSNLTLNTRGNFTSAVFSCPELINDLAKFI